MHSPGSQQPAAPIERLYGRMGEVSSLPDVALRIIELANDPAAGSDDLLEAVRSDPALGMRVMRTVNSAYSGLEQRVADLRQAVMLLGFNEVRNLALTAFVARIFRQADGHGHYSRRGLWNHMVTAALVAQHIARLCRLVPPEEAYLGGLLHDVGLILIDQYLHEPFCRVVDRLSQQTPICEVERRLLGFDHAQLGEFVAAKWRLPEHLTAAIAFHHSADQYDGSHRHVVSVVTMADFLCCLKGVPPLGAASSNTDPTRLLAGLGIDKSQLEMLLGDLDEILAAANVLAVIHAR